MELTKTSASQVKDFQACPRLWFFKNVVRKRPPQTEAQARGTMIHSGLEAYLGGQDVKLPDSPLVTSAQWQEYITALKPLVDLAPQQKSLVEYRDEMPTYDGGPTFVLVVDHAREVEVGGKIIPQIDDLKTLSDFRYCKTPDELAKDVQMVSYARWALRQFEELHEPPPDFVSLRHVYVRTRGKVIATERSRLVTPEEVMQQWALVVEYVCAMVALAAAVTDPMAVTPNTEHCTAYGGCYFRTDCHGEAPKSIAEAFVMQEKREKENKMSANTNGTTKTTSLLDRLRQKQGVPAPAPAAAAPAAATPTAPAAPAAAPAAAAPQVSRLRRTVTPAAATAAAAPVVSSVKAPEVLPPDAPPRDSAAPIVATEAPPKRGRQPKKPTVTVDTSAVPEATPAAPVAAPAAPVSTVAAVCKLEELYIDALPIKGVGSYGLAEDILSRAGADAAAKEGVQDWRMISYTSRGVLATAIRARLGEIPSVLVVSSSLSGSDVLIETLSPIARKVVRALRG